MHSRATTQATMTFRQTRPLANPPGSLTSAGCQVGCEMPLTSHTRNQPKAPFQPALCQRVANAKAFRIATNSKIPGIVGIACEAEITA